MIVRAIISALVVITAAVTTAHCFAKSASHGHVYGRVYGHVYGRVYGRVHGHVYGRLHRFARGLFRSTDAGCRQTLPTSTTGCTSRQS